MSIVVSLSMGVVYFNLFYNIIAHRRCLRRKPIACLRGGQLGCVTGSVSQTYFRFLPTKYASGKRVGAHKLAAGCISFVDELKPISVELSHAASPSEERLPSRNLADFRIAHLIENLDEA